MVVSFTARSACSSLYSLSDFIVSASPRIPPIRLSSNSFYVTLKQYLKLDFFLFNCFSEPIVCLCYKVPLILCLHSLLFQILQENLRSCFALKILFLNFLVPAIMVLSLLQQHSLFGF